MTLTITEASAVNVLLDHMLADDWEVSIRENEAAIGDAMVLLAGKANKALHAGWRPEVVREKWGRS